MRVLVVGSGGREHALAWKLARSPRITRLYAAPGNAGMEGLAERIPLPADDVAGLTRFARQEGVQLAVIGPEEPLALGLADAMRVEGIAAFGPTAAAARLESSKAFAKDFMVRHGLPTARHFVLERPEEFRRVVPVLGERVVVKADGLAAGKGVSVCASAEEAEAAVVDLMVRRTRGEAGARVVVEERIEGPECTVMAFCDGETLRPLPFSRDHKRLLDGGLGPNTGGMGAVAPVELGDEFSERLERGIFEPFLEGLRADGLDYRGLIYFGLMLTRGGPKLLEFNVRFGDPETQAVLPVLLTDLLDAVFATATGRLRHQSVEPDGSHSACVVLASAAYPGSAGRAGKIAGLEGLPQYALVFHSGTERRPDGWYATGGRVLGVTGTGKTAEDARKAAYALASRITFEGKRMRSDIGAGKVPA